MQAVWGREEAPTRRDTFLGVVAGRPHTLSCATSQGTWVSPPRWAPASLPNFHPLCGDGDPLSVGKRGAGG